MWKSLTKTELEFYKDYPIELIIGLPLMGVLARSKAIGMDSHSTF